MEKIRKFDELKKLSAELKDKKKNESSANVVVRIAMATCSIASGSKPVLDFFTQEMPKQPVDFNIISTGCTGLCHSEPTVEVTLPGAEPVMFGKVDVKKAGEIINEFIKAGKTVDGVIEGN